METPYCKFDSVVDYMTTPAGSVIFYKLANDEVGLSKLFTKEAWWENLRRNRRVASYIREEELVLDFLGCLDSELL